MLRHFKSAFDTLSTLLVVVAASALLWRTYQPAAPAPGRRPPVETVSGLTLASSAVTHVRGTGRVVLVEFADYECPFCARHAQSTAPAIKNALIDSGDIRHVFFNFPLAIHPRAQKAAEAAECAAEQGRFWEMHEQLFDDPQALELVDLSRHAESLDLDRVTFLSCLEEDHTAERVRGDLAEGRRLGVSSTPAFFVGLVQADGTINLMKRINGALPFEEFESAVSELLPRQRAE
jgi:protein-disulfide isomerase